MRRRTPGPSSSRSQQSLKTLGLKIERLQGRNQVEKIQRAYGYYVDKAQWPAIADLFTKDGTYEIGGRGVFVGPKRVLEYLVVGLGKIGIGSRYGQMIDHQQFQGVVNVSADGKHAWGRWTAFVMSSVGGYAGWGDCIYENEYVKEDGVWKVKHLRGPFQMYTSFDKSWKDAAVTNTWPNKFPPPPDLPPTVVYLDLSELLRAGLSLSQSGDGQADAGAQSGRGRRAADEAGGATDEGRSSFRVGSRGIGRRPHRRTRRPTPGQSSSRSRRASMRSA